MLAVAAGFILYVGLTRSPLFAGISILFYRGLILCALSAVLVMAAMALRRQRFDLASIVAAGALSLSFNICFLIVLPVTLIAVLLGAWWAVVASGTASSSRRRGRS